MREPAIVINDCDQLLISHPSLQRVVAIRRHTAAGDFRGVAPLFGVSENKVLFFGIKGVSIPAALSLFPDELYQAPKSWAEHAYPKLIYYNKLDKGGHFAAWEQPQLFAAEIRPAFRSLRWAGDASRVRAQAGQDCRF
jgi:pimeloyl-ACP methyl ester carboxylesterase